MFHILLAHMEWSQNSCSHFYQINTIKALFNLWKPKPTAPPPPPTLLHFPPSTDTNQNTDPIILGFMQRLNEWSTSTTRHCTQTKHSNPEDHRLKQQHCVFFFMFYYSNTSSAPTPPSGWSLNISREERQEGNRSSFLWRLVLLEGVSCLFLYLCTVCLSVLSIQSCRWGYVHTNLGARVGSLEPPLQRCWALTRISHSCQPQGGA